MSLSYKEICAGKSPWLPLGMFMHDFFGNFPGPRQRSGLVREPIDMPAPPTIDEQKWAAFCAASVDYLCEKYRIPCPNWVNNPHYILTERWYYGVDNDVDISRNVDSDLADMRRELEAETPEAFRKRGIYCSQRIYANKYEIATDLAERRRSA